MVGAYQDAVLAVMEDYRRGAEVRVSVRWPLLVVLENGQRVRIENHGRAGRLVDLRKVMAQVDQKNVGIKLNGDARDNEGGRFAENFAAIKDRLGDTLHMRMYKDTQFPYQLQWNLLVDAGWDGWCFVEESVKVPDRVAALIEEREMWEKMIRKAVERS